uniref:Integrase catalytic domain-containing protein n=1 Tax=Strigamia maritima TaxID=126957 RepID=T1JP39_STRMM
MNAYSPQMNETAEQINRTILDGVRALLADTDLPQELWTELSVTLTYLKNRYLHARLKQEIPYVNWRKRHLSLRHLRRPGCVAYVNIPKQKQDGKLNHGRVSWWDMPSVPEVTESGIQRLMRSQKPNM